MRKQVTVKRNKIVVNVLSNGKYEITFTDSFKTYPIMIATSISEVGMIAHEMADNNEIGRELEAKIRKALTK